MQAFFLKFLVTRLGFFWALVTLPFSISWYVVYYPVNEFITLMVEKMDDGQWYFGKRIKAYGGTPWTKTIKYLKDFRQVLYDHYKWPKVPSPLWRCKSCSSEAKYYCVETQKKMCSQCAFIQHTPGTNAAWYSVEEIIVDLKLKEGVHLFTPILPEILFCIAWYVVFFHQHLIEETYLTSQMICPTMNQVRKVAAYADANILYFYKDTFMEYCDYEDSFMRFIIDLWTRGVILGTDNTALVLQTFPKAAMVDLFGAVILCPIIGVFYATFMDIIYRLETRLPQTHTLMKLQDIIVWWDTQIKMTGRHFFGAGKATSFPPDTLPRTRKPMDIMDDLLYRKARFTKYWMFYYKTCVHVTASVAFQVLVTTLLARVALIWLHMAPTVQKLVSHVPILSSSYHRHSEMLGRPSFGVITEPMFWSYTSSAIEFTNDAVFQAPHAIQNLLRAWLIVIVMGVIGNTVFIRYLLYERNIFMAAFTTNDHKEVLEYNHEKVLKPVPVALPTNDKPEYTNEALKF
jgi:hypothetical protein